MPDVAERTVLRGWNDKRVALTRAADGASGGPGVLSGYALLYNSESRDLGGYVEVIAPGAFDLTSTGRVLCRWNHDSSGLLGTTDAGTLRLTGDETGVRYDVDLPATTLGRDIAVLAERGDVCFSSFAYWPLADDWSLNAQGILVNTITRGQLVDVAPVADPAYWGSTAGMSRSLDLDKIRASISGAPDSARSAVGLDAELALALALGDRITN